MADCVCKAPEIAAYLAVLGKTRNAAGQQVAAAFDLLLPIVPPFQHYLQPYAEQGITTSCMQSVSCIRAERQSCAAASETSTCSNILQGLEC